MNQESNLGELVSLAPNYLSVAEDDDVPLLKIKEKKARPPLTDKQKDALKKGQQKRLEGVEIKRAEKVLKAHELLSKKVSEAIPAIGKGVSTPYRKPVAKLEVEEEEEEEGRGYAPYDPRTDHKRNCEEEEEEEQIIYKKKSKLIPTPILKPKKKKKTIVIYESSSSSDTEETEQEDHYFAPPNRHLKSQQNNSAYGRGQGGHDPQNRKNIIQTLNERQVTKNFFCD
jgi:hypothetical protein